MNAVRHKNGTSYDGTAARNNNASERITFTNAAGTYVTNTYDRIGQLAIADSSVNTEDRGYFYDAAWNLNRRTNNGAPTTFSVDTKNQLTSGPAAAYAYDSNGNLVSTSSGLSYTYDDENRLVTIISTNSFRTVLIYDGLSRLRSREEDTWNGTGWIPGSPFHYFYDGNVVIEASGGGGFFTRGPDLSGTMQGAGGIGGLLAVTWGFGAGPTHYYYHADGNGNLTYLADSSQALAASYRYDPYGNTISSSGTKAAQNVYRFSSKEVHGNTGMYSYLYRWYDPNLQRWLNRDPMGEAGFEALRSGTPFHTEGEANLYRFISNAPGSFIDTDGLGVIALPLPGGIVIPIPAPIAENPIGGALVGGAAIGATLCWAFPNAMTKPGEWVGNWISPNPRTKVCTYWCSGGKAGSAGGMIRIKVPIDRPCSPFFSTPTGGFCRFAGNGDLRN